MRAMRAMARIAWRDARRNRGRSLLVVAMIAIPILGLTTVGAVLATANPTLEERATGQMGEADLAIFDWDTSQSIEEVLAHFPDAAVSTYFAWETRFVLGGELRHLSVMDMSPDDPILGSMIKLTSGTAPTGPDEIAVSDWALERFGLQVGDAIGLGDDGAEFQIVGTAVMPEQLHRGIGIVAPGSLRTNPNSHQVGLFVDFADNVSPRVIDDAVEASNLGWHQKRTYVDIDDGAGALAVSFAVTALVLAETCLIAAAAFVVGARRQLRTIGLVGAAGGEPRHSRALVISGGVLLGLVGSITGVLLGLALGWGLTPFLDRIVGRVTGALRFSWLLPIGAVLLGTVAATLAAYAPARTAARLETLDALASRTPVPRPAGAMARWGLAAVMLGLVITGSTKELGADPRLLTIGLFLAMGGFLFAIPFLVTLVGRIANRLPLGARIAARDTARHARRAGTAVAAATIALVLPIAVATSTLSADARQNRNPAFAPDQLIVSLPSTQQGSDSAQAFLSRLEAEVLPGAVGAVADNATYSDSYNFPPEIGFPDNAPVYVMGPPVVHAPGHISRHTAMVTIGGPELLYALHAEAFTQQLADGFAIVLGSNIFDDGVVRVENPAAGFAEMVDVEGEEPLVGIGTFDVPAVDASVGSDGYGPMPTLVVSAARATELGFEPGMSPVVIVRADQVVTGDQLAAAKAIAAEFPGFHVVGLADTKFDNSILRMIVLAFTGLIALAIIAVAVALISSESRRDQAILGAIGASPATRRVVVGSRALLLTVLAAVLAIPAGFLPITVIQTASVEGYPIVFPWMAVAVVLVLLPLVAGLVAGLGSRQPSETRMLRPLF